MDNKEITEKLGEDDVNTINTTIKETQDWLDANTTASKEEFEEKLKECESKFSKFSSKVYQNNTSSDGSTAMPTPEDVD
jgi:L1 cell adhesion molecule like protein